MAMAALRGVSPYSETMVGSATAHVKGAWIALSTATPFAAIGGVVVYHGQVATAQDRFTLFDIGIGAAGAEVPLLANLPNYGYQDYGNASCTQYAFTAAIPAGTRVSARMQSNVGSQSARLAVVIWSGAAGALPTPETYGALTATSVGTAVDGGTVANTKGAWVQFTPSCGLSIGQLLLCATLSIGTPGFTDWAFDIGVGAAGAEVVVLADVPYHARDIQNGLNPGAIALPVSIPAGSRIAVRLASSTTDAVDRVLRVVLVGMGAAPGAGSTGTGVAYACA